MSKDLGWADALDNLLMKRAEKVPEGWKTSAQVAAAMGMCEEMGKVKCKQLVAAGLAERREFRVKWGKMVRPRPHYRLVSLKKRP